MSSIESRAEENSNRINICPSRDSTEGTVDHLNEAPRYRVLCGHHYEYAYNGDELDAIVSAQLLRGVVAEVVVWLPDRWLRDGQPGLWCLA